MLGRNGKSLWSQSRGRKKDEDGRILGKMCFKAAVKEWGSYGWTPVVDAKLAVQSLTTAQLDGTWHPQLQPALV